MQLLIRLFLRGLATLIPLVLTITILLWLALTAERSFGRIIQWVLPETWYIPGMGLLAGLLLVIGVGALTRMWLFRRLFDLGESVLDRMPLVKSLYRAIKDFVDYFSSGSDAPQKAVRVSHPDLPIIMIGFVTREDFSDLPFGGPDTVAVYLPMSYQIGGYTLVLPRDWVEPLDMPFEDAMRLVLTGAVRRTS